ncbi:MAG: hypothetical protein NT036_06280 [Candidatus Omnitrophica bacterium]|nr:hypothetical protein [Candidatus Omnitrophota bacterium]
MVKTTMFILILFVALGVVGVVAPVYSQEKVEQSAVTLVSGEVVSVDLVKSAVIIKQIKDPVAGIYENQSIPVLPETKITKGDAGLKLSDLKAGDKVSVKCVADDKGKQKVESISVEVK